MLARQQLLALLNQLSQDVNAYLEPLHLSFVDFKNQTLFEKNKKRNDFRAYISDQEEQRYLFIFGEFDGNALLTAKRALNLIKVLQVIHTEIKDISVEHKTIDATHLKNKVQSFYQLIETAIEQNTALSTQFQKIHQTYQQNRLLGMSIFSSWWNKTWMQSHAMMTLEKMMKHIDQFSKKVIGEEIKVNKVAVVYPKVALKN